MKCEQYVYKANYLYTYYIIIFLTTHIHITHVPMNNIRVNGGVSHRSRTFLGMFCEMKIICLPFLLVYFYSLFGQQQKTECTAEGVWRVSPIEFIQQ